MGGFNVSGRGVTVEGEGAQSGQVSAFSPDDISGLEWWHDADALTGYNDGDTVDPWPDESAENNDFVVNAGAPTYRTNVLNGKPVVRFGGNEIYYKANTYTNGSPYTFFAVYDETGNNGNTMLIDEDTPNDRVLVFHNGSNIEWHNKDDNLQFTKDAPFNHYIYNVVSESNGDQQAYDNGALQDERLGANPRAWDQTPTLGGDPGDSSRRMDGDVAEVLVYNSALSDTDRQQVEQYLADKWGIALA